MPGENHEVEVKLRFDSADEARARIDALGARVVAPRHFEDNLVLDDDVRTLKSSGRLLRIRRRGDSRGGVMTLKKPVMGEHRHKVREEHETTLDDADAACRVLEGLGFTPTYRYQKYRTELELEGLHICVDETPVGCFVELEGAPDRIDDVAARLGMSSESYVLETYRDLHEQAARERGVAVADLLIERTGEDDA